MIELVGGVILVLVVGFPLALMLSAAGSGLDRLDEPTVARATPKERFGHQGRVRRLAGWSLWATPGLAIGATIGGLLWGVAGLIGGFCYALLNLMGTQLLLLDGFAPQARRRVIVLYLVQVPLGVIVVVLQGL